MIGSYKYFDLSKIHASSVHELNMINFTLTMNPFRGVNTLIYMIVL